MHPLYSIQDIKFSIDHAELAKAVALYSAGKVTKVTYDDYGCDAVVLGTKPYHVYVHHKHFDRGACECYLGQKDVLCKHMIAVALANILRGERFPEEAGRDDSVPVCSGVLGELSKEELSAIKKEITSAIRYIKYYDGPSRTWFAYQRSLAEGAHRLSSLFSKLPVSLQTASLIIGALLRIDEKVLHGVDDSDGTVGGFIQQSVHLLLDFATLDPSCKKSFELLKGKETSFGWEEDLIKSI